MNVFKKILKITIQEDISENDELEELVDEAIKLVGDDIAEYLYGELTQENEIENIIAAIDTSIWASSDNGHLVLKTMDKWLHSTDEFKIQIALRLDVIPFENSEIGKARLAEISRLYPNLNHLCQQIINHYSKAEKS